MVAPNASHPAATDASSAVRAAIYARVSSEKQAEEGTIASQLADLQQRLAEDQLSLDEQLCFVDDGCSGTTLQRPALERLRDMAAAGAIDRLYVQSPSRLSRNYAHQFLLVEELQQQCGVQVIFLGHPLGTSPETNLLLQVQGMLAEYERAQILERARRGKLYAARSGRLSVMSAAPYGYRYICRQAGAGTACWQVDWEQAAVVRQMFQWVALERLSLQQVAQRLQERGIATARGASRWNRGTVRGILNNPAYAGQAAFGRRQRGPRRARLRPVRHQPEIARQPSSIYEQPPEQWIRIAVPAIVEEELFATVQEQLQENRRRWRQRRQSRRRYLLAGLVVCAYCGYGMHGLGPGGRSGRMYYRCAGRDAYRRYGQQTCDNPLVAREELEAAVWADVQKLLSDPGRIQAEYERRLEGQDPRQTQRPAAVKVEALVAKVQRSIARLIDAYQEGLLSKAEFEPRLQSARERLQRLQAEAQSEARRQQQQKELRLVIGHLQSFAQQVRGKLATADWQTRRDILCALVKRVEVHKQQVRIVYRIDPGPPTSGGRPATLQHCWKRQDAKTPR